MIVELAGTVRMRGDSGPGTRVRVRLVGDVLEISSGEEILGKWPVRGIGIHALNEGFSIRAEGEDFVLVTDDDAALAESMGIRAASPRLARQVAARHRPERTPETEESRRPPSRVGPIAFALSGALVLVGASILRGNSDEAVLRGQAELIEGTGLEFWLAFTVAGALMVAVAFMLSVGARWARVMAASLVVSMVVVFGLAVSDTPTDAGHLTAYGFLAGGLAVGVAVLFSGSLEDGD